MCQASRSAIVGLVRPLISELLLGKYVGMEPVATNRYGRTMRVLRVGKNSVNDELLKDCLAWFHRR